MYGLVILVITVAPGAIFLKSGFGVPWKPPPVWKFTGFPVEFTTVTVTVAAIAVDSAQERAATAAMLKTFFEKFILKSPHFKSSEKPPLATFKTRPKRKDLSINVYAF